MVILIVKENILILNGYVNSPEKPFTVLDET